MLLSCYGVSMRAEKRVEVDDDGLPVESLVAIQSMRLLEVVPCVVGPPASVSRAVEDGRPAVPVPTDK